MTDSLSITDGWTNHAATTFGMGDTGLLLKFKQMTSA